MPDQLPIVIVCPYYIILYSILYEQNVHVYSQLQLFLSYGQSPVPRCPDKRSLSVYICMCAVNVRCSYNIYKSYIILYIVHNNLEDIFSN